MVEQSCTQITAKPRVTSTSPRRLDHQAWARFFGLGTKNSSCFFTFLLSFHPLQGKGVKERQEHLFKRHCEKTICGKRACIMQTRDNLTFQPQLPQS